MKHALLATAAAAIFLTAPAAPAGTQAGIDVLAAQEFAPLRGKRIGLITNHSGIDRNGRATIDLLREADGVELAALFSPEHGIRGAVEAAVDDSRDEKSGLPIYSLYKSDGHKPSAAQMRGLDALVFDIQDIGTRFYTYVSTMGLCMEAASEAGIAFYVLDRPNPIGAADCDGPVRLGARTFTAHHDIPIVHGMTAGELARMIQAEAGLAKLDLTVIPCEGWSRAQRFDKTKLPWVNPSPNIRNLDQAILYPGVAILEFCNVSVGRGTDSPFEIVGAPYLDGEKLAAALERYALPGVKIKAATFTPSASVFAGEKCGGVRFDLRDPDAFRPLDLGLALAVEIIRLSPEFDATHLNKLIAHPPTVAAIKAGKSLPEIRAEWEPRLTAFRGRRAKYLLYR